MAALLSVVCEVYLRWANQKKRQNQFTEEASRLRANFTVDRIGNKHPDFFFLY